MFEQQSRQLRRTTVLLDILVTVVVFLAAYWVRQRVVKTPPAELIPHLMLLGIIVPIVVSLLTFFGAYRSPRISPVRDLVRPVVPAVTGTLVVLLALLFVLKMQYVSRAIVITFGLFDAAALVGVRLAILASFRRSVRKRRNLRHVLIVGAGARAARLATTFLSRSAWGVSIVGYLDPDPSQVGRDIAGSPVLGTTDEITSVLKHHVIDEVILAVPTRMLPSVASVVRACQEEAIKVRLVADLFDVAVARVSLDAFDGIPLLTFETVVQDEWHLFLKRVLDIGLVCLGLPLILPLMAAVALAIKLDSAGPVFFVQERVGLNRRRLRMLKFRTMHDGSEERQSELESLNQVDGPIFKIFGDPRITRVGQVLRRTSLDELPQVINVIQGAMSLVGPRPLSLRDADRLGHGIERKRFSVKPGITGLWQVSGRCTLPYARWLELDLQYVEHWSLVLDAKILCRTIPAVLKGTGAA